jgi:outer membrane protein TolC
MSVDELKVLLDQVPDTRELILRRPERWSAEHSAWSEAHEEAAAAYREWRALRTADAYVAYRAAQDREDAAQDTLAAARLRL